MRRALLVYHYFAHYRLPVLKQLVKHHTVAMEFASGTLRNDNSIKLIDFYNEPALKERWRRLGNLWIKQRFLWQRGLLRLLAGKRYDAVIFLGEVQFLSTWAAIFLCKAIGIRVLFWTHGLYGNEGLVKRYARVTYYSLADKILLYGWHAYRIMCSQGFSKERVCVIYNSLDTDRQAGFRGGFANGGGALAELVPIGSPAHSKNLLFIGRLTIKKRLDLLLDAATILLNKGCPVCVQIIGDGPVREYLQEIARERRISDHIKFMGEIYEESMVGRMIYEADLVVSPGNVGLTAMHAMGYGTPVCTHSNAAEQMPEYEAIIPGVTGFFFRQGDSADLASKIMQWFSTRRDRAQTRVACVAVIDRFYNPRTQSRLILDNLHAITDRATVV